MLACLLLSAVVPGLTVSDLRCEFRVDPIDMDEGKPRLTWIDSSDRQGARQGAVGATVGQIAKIMGCRVIGIAGGAEKCRVVVEEFGFDACIDYREGNVRRALRELAPSGVDVYFDNVGGEILDDVLTCLARGARVVICGAISQYNEDAVRGPANYMMLLVARASMTGMLIFDYADRYGEALAEMAEWYRDGRLVSREQVVHGTVADFPRVLLMLFEGANTGKLVLALDGA